MKLSLKDTVKTALPLFLICVLVAAALGFTNELTKGPIAEIAALTEQNARKEILPIADQFEEIMVSGVEEAPCKAYDKEGNLVGYVVTTSANGYGGKVKVMTGFTLDGMVTGISILSQSETVGLGTRCEEKSFRDQFIQPIPENGYVVYKSGANAPDGGIEALTSATKTTNAVVAAVNAATQVYSTIAKGGK